MAELTRPEFDAFIDSTLPDNSTRQISALDLRTSLLNLADSIVLFNNDINISALNFSNLDTRSLRIGTDTLARNGINGFTSIDNTAVGYASLELSFSTARNTALGSNSASCVSLGVDNLALGVHSLGSTSTGSGNVGVGNFSLMGNKTGDFNIAIGHGAGYVAPSDSEFKFYLGTYPGASGDCDEHIDGMDKPPLLYGDLRTLQLAIGASGFRGSEKLAVSGDILPYESGGAFNLGSGDYRWNAYIQDLYVSGNIVTGGEAASFYQFKITDGLSAADTISNDETVAISGISGILTDYSSNIMRVSAAPLSGVIDSQFLSLSGAAPAFGGVSGLIWNVSGWAEEYADSVGAAAGAYTHWKVSDGTKNNNITAPPNAANTLIFGGISGVTTNYRADTNKLEISTHLLSGQIDSISGVNGLVYTASGNLQSQITTNDSRASGLISHTSGNLQSLIATNDARASGLIHASGDYLLNKIYNSGDYLLNYITVQDGIKAGDAIARENSISGFAIGSVEDYAYRSGVLTSGNLQHQLNLLSGTAPSYLGNLGGFIWNVSGWARSYTDAAEIAAGAYNHWKITDGSNTENIETTHTVKFEGAHGAVASYNISNNTLTISTSTLSGVAIGTSVINDARASGLIATNDTRASGLIATNDTRASGLISVTSGILDRFIRSTSGSVMSYSEALSGVLRSDINEIIDETTGTIDVRIAAESSDINTRITNELQTLRGENGLSGILNRKIVANSGYIEDLNYFFDNRASGYIDAVSGIVYDWDLFNFNGIVHTLSGVAFREIKRQIDDFSDDLLEGDTGKWQVGDQTLANTKPISFNSILNIVGKDGVVTFLDPSDQTQPFNLTVDAEPISGYIEGLAYEITGVQGCFETKINAVSGFALGTTKDYAYRSGVLVSGWAQGSFLDYDSRASGAISHVSGILRNGISDSGALISGWAHESFISYDDRASGLINTVSGFAIGTSSINDARASGYILAVSGDAQNKFTNLSGVEPAFGGVSGLIWNVSGWNKSYTDSEVQALSLASDAYLHWKISDGSTIRQIRSLEETQFLGISGIETQVKVSGPSGIVISARPVSGVLHGIIGESGALITTNYQNYADQAEADAISTAASQAAIQDVVYTNRASGLIDTLSGVLTFDVSNNDTRASGLISTTSGNLDSYIDTVSGYLDGYIVDNNNRASGLIATNDTRASGYILAVSGATITSAGSGLVRLTGGEFNTAGSGNFERVILNQNGTHPSGQIVADSGKHHDIVNSSGFLVVPTASTFDAIRDEIDPVANSGAVAFAGGHMRVSNGVTWHNPPVIEGFMLEDLDPPTNYGSPTSGKLLSRNESFETSDTYWVTNRDHTFAASGGYFLMAMLVNNEYRPVWSTCSGCPTCE